MPAIQIPQGTIHYREAGPADGRPVVFVHGFLMAGDVWQEVGERLARRGLRAIMPTWPLGAHPEAMRPDADLGVRGQAAIVAALLEAMDLDDAILAGNDSGGAICQLVAVDHPARVGALVLTSCDAFENCPPSFFKAFVAVAKIPGGLRAALAPMRTAAARRSPAAYGLLSHGDVDHLARGWVRPALEDPRVLDDARRFVLSLGREVTLDAAARLGGFERPVLLAFSADDKLFPPAHADRLAEILPDARVAPIDGARTLSMIDRPELLAELMGEFALQRSAAGQAMR